MVEVPEGAVAGQQLQVTAPNGQLVTVTVPEGMVPGQQLQVEVPAAPAAVPEEMMVEVPEGVVAGQQLTVTAPNGQEVTVTVPEGMVPGQQLQVEVPAAPAAAAVPEEMMVEVPEGAVAGQQLQVTAPNGQEVTVTVPEGMVPGQQLQVEVPKNAVRLAGAASLDKRGGGAAQAVGEEPGLLQAAELQAEATALRHKLAEAEARLVAAAKEVEEAGIPALAAFSINIEVPEGGIPDRVPEEAGVLPQQLAASQEEVRDPLPLTLTLTLTLTPNPNPTLTL